MNMTLLSRMKAVSVLTLGVAALGIGALTLPAAEGETRTAQPQAVAGGDRDGSELPAGAIARLGAPRFHGVRGCLAFSPDGKLLATATVPAGATIALWDVAAGRVVRRFAARATLTRLAFSSDGKRLVCSDNSSGSQVFDATTGKELFQVKGSHAAFAGDGKTLLTAEGDGIPPHILAWDAGTGRPLRRWPITREINLGDSFAQGAVDMTVAAAAPVLALIDRSDPLAVQIRDVVSGELVRSLRPASPPSWLALAPDGKTLAAASRPGVELWDTRTGKPLRSWAQRADCRPVFAADGKRLAWRGSDVTNTAIHLWTVALDGGAPQAVGKPVNTLDPPCFSPDGKVLAVVTIGRSVQLRRIADGNEAAPLDAHDGSVFAVAFTPDGRHVVSRAGTGIFTWEARTGRLVRRCAADAPAGEKSAGEAVMAFLPDGRLLTAGPAPGPGRGAFCVREPLAGREVLRIDGRPDVGTIAVAPEGRYVGLGAGREGGFSILDLQTGRWGYRGDPREAHFGPKLSADGAVLTWHRRTERGFEMHVLREGKRLLVPGLPAGSDTDRWLSYSPCVSPDGRWVVLPGAEGELRRWDLVAGKEASPLKGAQRTVWDVSWSPDGRILLARGSAAQRGVRDREARHDLRAWHVGTGTRLPRLDLEGAPTCVLFSPDGRTLVTADREVILLREVTTGRERGRLPGHPSAWVNALALSQDGRLLASGGDDAQVLVWDLTARLPIRSSPPQ